MRKFYPVLDEISTGRKFRQDILSTWNRAKVSFCSDWVDNRMKFSTFVHGFTVSSCAEHFLTQWGMASRKRKTNSNSSRYNEYFTWTDEETAILLNVALSYLNEKTSEGKEWELIRTRFEESHEIFFQRYPKNKEVCNKAVYKIIQIVCALWLAIKPFYMSVCKHGFRSSFISYFIKEM